MVQEQTAGKGGPEMPCGNSQPCSRQPTHTLQQKGQNLEVPLPPGEILLDLPQNEEGDRHTPVDSQQCSKVFNIWKLIFMAVTFIQFSIHFSLTLIYFISSKIGLVLMLILLLIAIVFMVSLLVLVWNVRVQPFNEKRNTLRAFTRPQKPAALMENAHEIATRSKIQLQNKKRDVIKTKKIEFQPMAAHITNNFEETAKKLKLNDPSNKSKIKQAKTNILQKINLYFKIAQVVAITHLIFIFATATTLIVVFETVAEDRTNARIILMGVSYSLVCLSVACLMKLKWEGRKHFSKKVVDFSQESPKQSSLEIQARFQPQTKVSIDHVLQQKVEYGKSTISIQREIKSFSNYNAVSESKNDRDILETHRDNLEDLQQRELKKSVLKSSKLKLPKKKESQYQQELEEEIHQRRKVEINSKKIQYFEYSQISPSNSLIDSQQDARRGKIDKPRFSNQRAKYLKQKLQQQAIILYKKKEENRRASTSRSTVQVNIENNDFTFSEKYVNRRQLFS